MRKPLCGVFLGYLLSGCAPPQPTALGEAVRTTQVRAVPVERAAAQKSPATLNMQILLYGPEGMPIRAVAHRETLPSGSRVAVRVSAAGQSLWLYAYHRSSEGTVEPLVWATQLAAADPRELPGAGAWYRLQGAAGKEVFYAIATREPLSPSAQQQLAAELPSEREPPPLSGTSNRFPGPTYTQVLDDRGMAVLAVSVLHPAAAK